MIERIRYGWGALPPVGVFPTAPPLRGVEWTAPAIPPQVLAAVQVERISELSGAFGKPRIGQSTPVEHFEVQLDGRTTGVTVYDRLGAGEALEHPDGRRVARFCEALAGAAFGPGRQGAPGPGEAATAAGRPPEDSSMRDFFETLYALSPHARVTRLMIFLNALVFVSMMLLGINAMNPPVDKLIDWGANYAPLVLQGETWRLLASAFLHGGLWHLAINMYALWDGGNLVERMVGSAGFLVLYIASALAGSLASVWWSPALPSVGASGAVFGVFGGLLGFALFRKEGRYAAVMKRLLKTVGAVLGLNLVLGATIPIIDNAAHIGGMVAGLICGMIMSRPLEDPSPTGRWVRAGIATLAAVVGLGAMSLALPFEAAPAPPANPAPPGGRP